jgi:hypothetical protein
MKKFILTKTYPGGPKTIGLVVYENGPFYESNFHTENVEHFHQTRDMVEGFPEIWQELTELVVPVGTIFKHMSDEENVETYKIESTDEVYVVISWSMIRPGSIMYTVKEVNDYFKKGIWVEIKSHLTWDELEHGKIYRTSYPNQGDFIFKCGYNLWANKQTGSVQTTPTTGKMGLCPENGFYKFYLATDEEAKLLSPRRVSEDGVELFDGDIMYRVSLVSNYSLETVMVREELPPPISYFKDFSTKELAQAYIDLYKPQYSMQDIINMAKHNHGALESLKFNVKEVRK